jgi:ribosome-associated protein
MIEINSRLSIPADELSFSASRAGGPGGQHVNKVSTQVTLRFDLDGSPSLSEAQKRRIRSALATRITREGILRVVCGRRRSQAANRVEATERFAELLRVALRPRKRRVATRVPGAQKRRRLEQKRQRSRLKRARGRPAAEDE